MARKRSPTLTDAETRVMEVLWQLNTATVADVLRILEMKGYVTHDKVARAFIYTPVVDKRQARRRALRQLVSRLFDNSPSLLVLNVLDDDRIDPAELKRLKKLIEDS